MKDNKEFEDDGRVVADMSDIELTPVLLPKLERLSRSSRRDIGRNAEEGQSSQSKYSQPVYVDKDERRALIGGALSAALLVGGVLAVAFGALIFIMLHIWG